jgi:hypothetical protein
MSVGAALLLITLRLVDWADYPRIWPAVLVVAGLVLALSGAGARRQPDWKGERFMAGGGSTDISPADDRFQIEPDALATFPGHPPQPIVSHLESVLREQDRLVDGLLSEPAAEARGKQDRPADDHVMPHQAAEDTAAKAEPRIPDALLPLT